MIRKLVVTDGRGERELLLVGTIVVGRDPTCHVNDLDPLLSRRHAEFVSNSRGVIIRDLNSRNGILVNGKKVAELSLKPGDVVQLGHLHVRYVEEYPAPTKEEEVRAHATTTHGSVPTIAVIEPVAPPYAAPVPPHPAHNAPTEAAPSPARSDAAAVDPDATVAPVAAEPKPMAAPPVRARSEDDPDATRGPGMSASPTKSAENDPDATVAPVADETRAPVAKPRAAARTTAAPAEARLVADSHLLVTEASPSCHEIIGARPETLVGGRLADAVGRTLTFVASGDGPASLSLTIARASSGRTITITVKAGGEQ